MMALGTSASSSITSDSCTPFLEQNPLKGTKISIISASSASCVVSAMANPWLAAGGWAATWRRMIWEAPERRWSTTHFMASWLLRSRSMATTMVDAGWCRLGGEVSRCSSGLRGLPCIIGSTGNGCRQCSDQLGGCQMLRKEGEAERLRERRRRPFSSSSCSLPCLQRSSPCMPPLNDLGVRGYQIRPALLAILARSHFWLPEKLDPDQT